MKFGKFALAALLAPTMVFAASSASMMNYVNGVANNLASNQAIKAAIMAANTQHAGLTETQIIALDNDWRAEVGSSSAATIDPILNSAASDFLRTLVAESGGQITEIIVMDNRGLNAAISDVTSDYWQGDEDKYLQTYAMGPEAVHISDIEFDESTQTYQAQVSVVIIDRETDEPIGAVTVGLNAEAF